MMKSLKKMFGKSYINTIISVLLTFAVLWGASPLWLSRYIAVSFYSDSVKNIEYQIFYTENEGEKFNPEQSVKLKANSGVQKVKVNLPIKKIISFRLDFGHYPQTASISGLKIRGNKTIRPDYRRFKMHQINKHRIENGGIVINSNQDDPYMVYTLKLNLSAGFKIDWCLFIILVVFPF